jgi:hypothetical protein
LASGSVCGFAASTTVRRVGRLCLVDRRGPAREEVECLGRF